MSHRTGLCARAVRDGVEHPELYLAAAKWLYKFRPPTFSQEAHPDFHELYEGLLDAALDLTSPFGAAKDKNVLAEAVVAAKKEWLSKVSPGDALQKLNQYWPEVRSGELPNTIILKKPRMETAGLIALLARIKTPELTKAREKAARASLVSLQRFEPSHS